MDFGKPGWLNALLAQAVGAHTSAVLPERFAGFSPSARARAFVRAQMHESGLRYGTPTTPLNALATGPNAPEERLFLAVLCTLAELGLSIADVLGAPKGNRVEQLRILFALLTGELETAAALDRFLKAGEAPSRRLTGKVESALAERAMSLSGDPVYGLVLHNGALYVDAQLFGHQAREYFRDNRLYPTRAERRLLVAGRQKAVLVEVLTALACAERSPSYAAQRAILRQIDDLKLEESSALKARVKLAFERKPRIKNIVRKVRSPDVKGFILEQTVLAALVEGRREPAELAFVAELARVLRISDESVKSIEVSVAEFYAKNRSVVDVFTVSAGAGLMGEELMGKMERTLEKNFQRLLKEVRQTGDLSLLLAKAARGHALSPDEKRRMRTELLDVAKAIPALAIFAAPGGVLLLVALAKVLPFNILPSAFQDVPPEPEVTDPGVVPIKKTVG